MREAKKRIISVDELYGVYRENNSDELIIDLRLNSDYRSVYIEDSMNLPFNKLQASSFRFEKVKSVYLICKMGSEAPMAAKQMSEIYPDLTIYYITVGGFDEWLAKKYPVRFHEKKRPASKSKSMLEKNEPDTKHILKQTRLLPENIQEKIKTMLPTSIKIYHFKDHKRNAYLICDMEKKEAVVINPLVEIHHHIIDQMVRSDCSCELVVYFQDLTFSNSPRPLRHAKDFAGLVQSKYCSVEELFSMDVKHWTPFLSPLEDKNGEKSFAYRSIAFLPPSFTTKQLNANVSLHI